MTPREPETDADAPLLAVPWKGGASVSLEERTRQAIAAREFEGDVKRARLAAAIGLVVWLAFLPFDYLQAIYLGHGHFEELVTIRLVMAGYIALVATFGNAAVAGRRILGIQFRPSAARLEFLFLSVLAGMTTCLAVSSLYTGGFQSLYGAGILLSTSAIILVPRHMSTMAWRMLVILLPYPIVMWGSTLFLPEMRAAVGQPRPMAFTLSFHFVGLLAAIFLSVVAHILWSMRRELYISQSVGRYRLKKKLGSGGMGEVWSAYHHGLRRDVAVKILRGETEGHATAAKRFEREIRAMAGLAHPNTVRLYDFGVAEDGRLYYAMELLEGRTLRALVKEEGALAPARAVHLILQASHALAEAHARGIVHRDVKAENLFVTTIGDQSDLLKVLDFGIAAMNSETRADLTRTGSVAGTPGTMSPEVILGEGASAASDVYALGAVLYQLLTGELPFGEDPGATLIAHVQQPPVPPSVRRPDAGIPEDVENILLRCLEKTPAHRFPNASELARALGACSLVGRWRPGASPATYASAAGRAEPVIDEDAATRTMGRRSRGESVA